MAGKHRAKPTPKPKVDPSNKQAVLLAVLDLLSDEPMKAAQIAGKLNLELGTVSNALNTARTELFVEAEGVANRGYTYVLTPDGKAHLVAAGKTKADDKKQAPGAARASGGNLKAPEPPPRLMAMPAEKASGEGKTLATEPAPLPAESTPSMAMTLQEKLKQAIKPSAATNIDPPPAPRQDATAGREAAIQQFTQTMAAVGQKMGGATVDELSQAQGLISKQAQQLQLANEEISRLEDLLRKWTTATHANTPQNASQRFAQLEQQLTDAQAVQLNAAVGRAAEIQRQWQAATGKDTPEAAKLEFDRLMDELKKAAASDAAAVGALGQVANAFARRDKRRVTGISGIQTEPDGTVLMVFDRQVSARAVVVHRTALCAWARAIEQVAK